MGEESRQRFGIGIAAAIACTGLAPVQAMDGVIREQSQAAQVFHDVGLITRIDAAGGMLTIDAGAIPGFMEAMEMQYRLASPRLASGLKVGDRIDFDVDGRDYTVLRVRKIAGSPSGTSSKP